MTRTMQSTGNTYRAVITTVQAREGQETTTFTRYEGPYATHGAALARLTRAQNEATEWSMFAYLGSDTVTGHVEKSTTTWERV